MSTALLGVILFAILSAIHAYKYVEVTFYRANSKCDKSKLLSNQTFVLNQCYRGTMYDCEASSVTYMLFGGANCGSMYPDSYSLPAFYCMSSVYGYSSDDTYMRCY